MAVQVQKLAAAKADIITDTKRTYIITLLLPAISAMHNPPISAGHVQMTFQSEILFQLRLKAETYHSTQLPGFIKLARRHELDQSDIYCNQ
jgi:hypothetical protein